MKKKLVTLLAFITTALVLVACGGAPGGGIIPMPEVEATQEYESTGKFTRDGTVAVRVDRDLSGQFTVFEVTGTDVGKIIVYDDNHNILAGSNSSKFFVGPSDVSTLEAASLTVSPHLVVPTSECAGPCVLIEKTNVTQYFYVEVQTDGDAELYAYMAGLGDVGEPDNDQEMTSPNLKIGDQTHHAAFETLGDIDFYYVSEDMKVTIDQLGPGWGEGLQLVVHVYNQQNVWEEIPASTFDVYGGEMLRLQTKYGYAGTFDASEYSIAITHQ